MHKTYNRRKKRSIKNYYHEGKKTLQIYHWRHKKLNERKAINRQYRGVKTNDIGREKYVEFELDKEILVERGELPLTPLHQNCN